MLLNTLRGKVRNFHKWRCRGRVRYRSRENGFFS